MLSSELIVQELSSAYNLLEKVLTDKALISKIDQTASLMATAIKEGNKILSAGNGGSHCDAMHFAEELTGRYRENRPAYPAIAISDPSHLSCVSNDYGYQFVFSRYIEALGNQGDVILAISTSGNSKNIIEMIKVAQSKGIKVVTLTGNTGGEMAHMNVDIELRVPFQGYADRIQEIHIKLIHILIMLIEKKLA